MYICKCICICICIHTRFDACGTRVSRTLRHVRGKRVDRLSVGAAVDSQIELLLPKRANRANDIDARSMPTQAKHIDFTSMPAGC